MARPEVSQKVLSSGRQSVSTAPDKSADMLGLVNFLHLGEFRQFLQRFADDAALHLPDRDMHPDQRAADQQEQQHEAAGPKSGQVDQRAERDREHETAETADHADQPADGADIIRVVDRDVLVDGGLAERHEEAEHEHGHRERHQCPFPDGSRRCR